MTKNNQQDKELRILSKQLQLKFFQKWIGTTQEVLWEDKIDSLGRKLGKQEYLPIILAKDESNETSVQAGDYTQVKIKGIVEGGLLDSEISFFGAGKGIRTLDLRDGNATL